MNNKARAIALKYFQRLDGRSVTDLLAEALARDRDCAILFLPVFLAMGIGGYFALAVEPPLLVSLMLLLVALAIWAIARGRLRPPAFALLLVATGLTLGSLRSAIVAAPVLQDSLRFVGIEGTVKAVEALQDGHRRLILGRLTIDRLAPEQTPARLRLTARAGGDPVSAGDKVRLKATLEPPPEPVAPGAFDFARDAWFDRIGGVGYAVSKLQRVERARQRRVSERIEATRGHIAGRVRSVIEGREGGIAAALLTGLRGGIAEEDAEAMRIAGLAHLLAISGLHIGLVTGTAFFAIRLLLALTPAIALRYDSRRIAAAAAWGVAFCYMLLAGATLPTQRAFLMVSVALLALMLGRRPISLRLLAFAAIPILVLSPEALVSASFQMSFAAVTALVAAYEAMAPHFARWRRDAGPLRRLALYFLGLIFTTIVAELAILPFSMFHFNQITSYGLLANMVAVPLTALFVMPLGLLAIVLMPFGLDAPALSLMGVALDLILGTAHQVAALPGAEFVAPSLPVTALAAFSLGGLILLLWRQLLLRAFAIPFFLAAGIAAGASRPPDLLVSRDGALFAYVGEKALAVSSLQRERYSREQWARIAGLREVARWDRPFEGEKALAACDPLGCLLDGQGIAIALTPEALVEDCRRAEIVIASIPVRQPCRLPTLVIDRFDIWREGPHALWLGSDRPEVRTVRESRGQRPWAIARGASGSD